jgi:hypothetical protein
VRIQPTAATGPVREPVKSTDGRVEVRFVLAVDGSPVPAAEVHHLAWDRIQADCRPRVWDEYRVDPEAALRIWGTALVSDAAGIAQVPADADTVVARSGSLYGSASRPQAPGAIWTVRLTRDSILEVDVVDATGRPAPGVRIGVGYLRKIPDGIAWMTMAVRAESDESGRATFPHAQQLRPPESIALDRNGRITACEPGLVDRFGPVVDAEALPAGPVRFVLPPHGSVEVDFVDALGRVRSDTKVGWSIGQELPPDERPAGTREDPSFGGEQFHSETSTGRQSFPWVGLGRRYWIRAATEDEWEHVQFDGPQEPGQTVDVKIPRIVGRPILEGRVHRSDGSLPRGMRIAWRCILTRREGGGIVAVDPDGRFAFALAEEDIGLVVERLALLGLDGERFDGELGYIGWKQPLRAGSTDVGEVILETAPLVCAGVIEGDPDSIQRARLRVQRPWSRVHEGEILEGWSVDARVFEIRDGPRFRFVGEVVPGRFRLMASVPDALPIDPLPFGLGQDDLRVVIPRGGAITAAVAETRRLGRGGMVVGRAVRVDGGIPHPDEASRLEVADRRILHWPSLSPGTYEVSISVLGSDAPFATARGVIVRDGETTPIGPFELPATLRTLEVTVTPPDGVRLPAGATVILAKGDLDGPIEGYRSRPDVAYLTVDRPSVDLIVVAEGCRAERIHGVMDSIEVQLRGAWSRRFSVDAPVLPEGHVYRLRVEGTDAPAGRLRTDMSLGSVAGVLGLGSRDVELGDAAVGVAEFMVPGTYAIELFVMRAGASRWQIVHGVSPATFEIGDGLEGTVEVIAPVAEVTAAIAKRP